MDYNAYTIVICQVKAVMDVYSVIFVRSFQTSNWTGTTYALKGLADWNRVVFKQHGINLFLSKINFVSSVV